MITRREAERLCKSFLGDNSPPRLPDNFAFEIVHDCAWGCRGQFVPGRYNSSRAKCIKCSYCAIFFSPNKVGQERVAPMFLVSESVFTNCSLLQFVFHSHRLAEGGKYVQPDAANFNSWRRHIRLLGDPPDEVVHSWEDVKAMFNGGTRKRMMSSSSPLGAESPPPAPPPLGYPALATPAPATTPPCKQVKLEVNINIPIRILIGFYRFAVYSIRVCRCPPTRACRRPGACPRCTSTSPASSLARS